MIIQRTMLKQPMTKKQKIYGNYKDYFSKVLYFAFEIEAIFKGVGGWTEM